MMAIQLVAIHRQGERLQIKEELVKRIEDEIKQRRGRVVTLNTIRALLGITTDPIGTIGNLFFGAKEAVDRDKHQIEQDIIIDLLCKIDDDISEAARKANEVLPKTSLIVLGEIIAHGKDTESVTGVDVSSDSGPVEFKSGTKITARGERVRNVTALKIGDGRKEGGGTRNE